MERRASITQQMNKLELTYEFVDGVLIDSSRLKDTGYNERSRLLCYGYGLTCGEVGCFLAHREAWKKVITQEYKCLILEDDARVLRLDQSLIKILENSPYPLVRIAGIFEKRHKFIGSSSFAKYWGDPSGAAAYVLGPKEAKRLLEKSRRFYMAVDDFMEARHLHGINTYAFLPYPVRHAGIDTYIGDRSRPRLSVLERMRLALVRIPIDFQKYLYRSAYYGIGR